MAFCLTMSDSEPVQLLEKERALQNIVCIGRCIYKGGVVAGEQSLKQKRKLKILICPEKFQEKVFTK